MKINCVWEHNGNDTLLYAVNLPGAYTRGERLEIAMGKMSAEAFSYLRWKNAPCPDEIFVEVVQEAPCSLQVRDADSDVLFEGEKAPLSMDEYLELKDLVLKSASDFLHFIGRSLTKIEAIGRSEKLFTVRFPVLPKKCIRTLKM